MDLAAHLSEPDKSQALFCWNNNIVASNPQQAALRTALRREDLLHVVVDLFQTDTADYADFVLPAASFLEFDDLVLPYFHNAVSAQVKVAPPPGECLPNQEIFRRLARAMGMSEPELFQSDAEIIAEMLAQAGIEGGFELLAERGTVFPFDEPLIQFELDEVSDPERQDRVGIGARARRRSSAGAAPACRRASAAAVGCACSRRHRTGR